MTTKNASFNAKCANIRRVITQRPKNTKMNEEFALGRDPVQEERERIYRRSITRNKAHE